MSKNAEKRMMTDKPPRYFILTGNVRSGKTSLLKRAVFEIKRLGFQVNGLLSLEHKEGTEHTGYDGFAIQTEVIFPLARTIGQPGWERSGRYFFHPAGMDRASQSILDFKNADLTVIDEAGPLEMEGKGLSKALISVLQHLQPSLIVVRSSFLPQFCAKIPSPRTVYDNETKECFEHLISDIKRLKT